jgi:hypothetical protein
LKKLLAALLAALSLVFPAAAQVLPSNLPQIALPANSVIGNSSPVAGNANAIPFGVLSPALLQSITGDLTCTVSPATCVIGAGAVTNAKLANVGANTVKGSIAGGTPADLTQAQLTTLCNLATTSLSGCIPALPGNTTTFLRGDGTFTSPSVSLGAITVQRFTSGSAQTYTPTVGTLRIHVRMAGGGGGGGAGVTNNGSGGGDSSFGTWTAIHGNGGSAGAGTGGPGGAGGSGGTNGTGTLVTRFSGGTGGGGFTANTMTSNGGGMGGSNPFGGAAGATSQAGAAAAANTGAGGGGGYSGGVTQTGGGGGAGEYVEFWMTAAQIGASQTYTVGNGGNGGAAGGNAGGNGAAGIIIVEEYPF